jgi:GNAT superfamily N-acetyltransferase
LIFRSDLFLGGSIGGDMAVQSAHEIAVRRMAKEDSPLVESLCSASLPVTPPEKGRRLANLREGIHLIAFVGVHLAGHLALLPVGDAAELTCFVRQDFRRQGVATALMEAALQEARASHCSAIIAFDDTHSVAVRRGLLNFGFEILWEAGDAAECIYPLT